MNGDDAKGIRVLGHSQVGALRLRGQFMVTVAVCLAASAVLSVDSALAAPSFGHDRAGGPELGNPHRVHAQRQGSDAQIRLVPRRRRGRVLVFSIAGIGLSSIRSASLKQGSRRRRLSVSRLRRSLKYVRVRIPTSWLRKLRRRHRRGHFRLVLVLARNSSSLAPADGARVLFSDQFSAANGPSGLITNEWALNNPDSPAATNSYNWEMTSGSFFSLNGTGWTGHPDTIAPNANSTNGTDSAVFRLRTKRSDFQDVRADVDVRVNDWVIGAGREEQEPGVVIWMRYETEFQLYRPSVLQRSGQVDVEKKIPAPAPPNCPSGDPNCYNGGDYYILPPSTVDGWPVTLGRWYHITVTAQNGPGSVTISTYRDGALMERAVDSGVGQVVQGAGDGEMLANPTPAISGSTRLGIRGDNADFNVDNFVVTAQP